MKQQDFDRLKAICEKEGFTIESYSGGKTAIIGVKDIWEGCEYIEITCDSNDCVTNGKIYPISSNESNFFTIKNDLGESGGLVFKEYAKPSTEQAYVDQLKKEAFERVGNLSRQETDFTGIHGGFIAPNEEWIYRKDTDTLYWYGAPIYQAGKWATKLPKRIEVRAREMDSYISKNHSTVKFDIIGKSLESEDAHKLASQLEKYLNGEL